MTVETARNVGNRTEVVATRLSAAEAAAVDALRGSLTRAQWLRMVVRAQIKAPSGGGV
jgi:hypothetical protein